MTLDLSGFLLEGVRVAAGNNPFTFPPQSVVSSQPDMDASPGRAEYMLFVSGQAPDAAGIEIADPALRILWTRNDLIPRFDYNSFARRWDTMPGSAPEAVGPISNSPRLRVPVPVEGAGPYALYAGTPTRVRTFLVSKVGTESDFTAVTAGTVQVAADSGLVNFSTSDVSDPALAGSKLMLCRQGFFDRTVTSGQIGSIPGAPSGPVTLFLNPIPAAGQAPRVRVGLRRHLSVLTVAVETGLYDPPAGSVVVALDTGAVRISAADAAASPGQPVFYDGVTLGSVQLGRGTVGAVGSGTTVVGSLAGAGSSDPSEFVVFADSPTGRQYLQVQSGGTPPSGYVSVDPSTMVVSVSPDDMGRLAGLVVAYALSVVHVERGVSVRLYRSAVNGSWAEQEPDFVEVHRVSGQVLQDGVTASPMVALTASPVDDSALRFRVAQGDGGGGSYVGDLRPARDPSDGPGYYLDPSTKSMRFSFRRSLSVTLDKPASVVKLPDAAVLPDGLSVSVDGVRSVPGTDFDFDGDTGLIEFVEPVGEAAPGNRSVAGTADSNAFESAGSFSVADVGKQLLVRSGPDAGFHRVTDVLGSDRAFVAEPFLSSSPMTVEVKASKEVVVDRVWGRLTHAMRKLRVEALSGVSDTAPVALTDDQYSVIPDSGQISLSVPAKPGQAFRTTYLSLESEDGVTFVSVPRTELAGFKIRQEVATSAPGASSVSFNPSGRTVLEPLGITVSVDGVTADPSSYRFVAPGAIALGGAPAGEVVVDYWVAESPGGNVTFRTSHAPMDVDPPTISGLDSSASPVTVLNGDKTGQVSPGGAVLVDGKSLLIVRTSRYDAASGTTSVVFVTPPRSTSRGVPLLACGPVDDVMADEDASVDVVPVGTNTVVVHALRPYSKGTVVTLDGDAYLAIAASQDGSSTLVTLSAPASRNYVLPAVRRSVRPVYDPSGPFATSLPPSSSHPFTLVRSGPRPSVLVRGTDFTVSDGGQISLLSPPLPGESIEACYVGRVARPAGTVISGSYASAASPDASNGVAGQKLLADYNLYSPDTFFYRVESVTTFVPEVVDSLRQSASSSSGPSVASRARPKAKDMGSKSPWFDEQHLLNVDVVVGRLLAYYNDFVNRCEDLLAGYDGRVVGGTSGRFRYDGSRASPPRASYSDVRNDIDDEVKLYDKLVLDGFFTFHDVPVYARMYESQPLSRLFPTSQPVVLALNGNVGPANLGRPLGSIGIPGLTSVGSMTQSVASTTYKVSPGTALFRLARNGGASPPARPFSVGMPVILRSLDGTPDGVSTIVGLTQNPDGSWDAAFSPVPSSPRGSVETDTSAGDQRVYSPGRDLSVDMQSGQVLNASLPAAFSSAQVPVSGNELVDVTVSYGGAQVSPRRIPALDGSTLTDSGAAGSPSLLYRGEVQALEDEAGLLPTTSRGAVSVDLVTVTNVNGFGSRAVFVGAEVVFLDGPNAGLGGPIASVTSSTQFVLANGLNSSSGDATFSLVVGGMTSKSASAAVLSAINGAAEAPPGHGAVIGRVASQVSSIDLAVRALGPVVASGSASFSAGSASVSDPGMLAAGVVAGHVLYATDGAAAGVYLVTSVTSSGATVSLEDPFAAPSSSGTSSYVVISPPAFVTPAQFGQLSKCLRTSLAFYSETQSWASSFSMSGVGGRLARIAARIAAIESLTTAVSSSLRDGRVYDTRFLWIQQRTDRQTGCLTGYARAVSDREAALTRLASDQQKLLVASRMV